MPDRQKTDSPQVPEDRDRQRTNLVRLVVVVGLPLLSVLLRLPIWFTLLLMLGLAVALFIAPYLSTHKEQPEPKKAWTLLMANYVKLQSACDALRQSPDDPEARKRYATYEQRCQSLLSGRPESDWGTDAGYAAKIKDEITAMSASFGAKSDKAAPAPGQEASPPAPTPEPAETSPRETPSLTTGDALAPKAEPEAETPAAEQPPTPVAEITVVQPESTATTAGPVTPPPVEMQASVPSSGIAVAQPEANQGPLPVAEVPPLAEELSPEPPVEAATAQPIKSLSPAVVEAHEIAPTVEVAAMQPVANPEPSPVAEVPPVAEERSLGPAVEDVTARPIKSEAPTLVEPHEIAPAVGVAAVQPVASPEPPPAAEVPALTEEQSPVPPVEAVPAQPIKPPASALVEPQATSPVVELVAAQPVSPEMPEGPVVTTPTEKLDSAAEVETAVAQTESPALPATPEANADGEEHAAAPAEEAPVMLAHDGAAAGADSVNRAEEQTLTPATGGAEPATCSPAPAVEQVTVPEDEKKALLTDSGPSPTALPDVSTPPPKQDVAPVTADATIQAANPASAAGLSAAGNNGRRLIPYVWLPGSVEEAAAFYSSVFKRSHVTSIRRYPEGAYAPGNAMSATVNLDGQELILLNGGPSYGQPEAFSLLLRCKDQAEIDYYWERLPAGGGEVNMCGWLKDRFGVSWQVIPDALLELLNDPDPRRAARANEAMLRMKKIDIASLREAAETVTERGALAAS